MFADNTGTIAWSGLVKNRGGFLVRAGDYSLSTGPALVPIHFFILWVQRFPATEFKQPRGEADHSFQVTRLSIRKATSLLQQTSLWSGVNLIAGQKDTRIVTCRLRARIAKQKEAAVVMQWRGKHVSAAMNDHETIKGL
jgi:hypothetical protein